MEDEERGGNEQ